MSMFLKPFFKCPCPTCAMHYLYGLPMPTHMEHNSSTRIKSTTSTRSLIAAPPKVQPTKGSLPISLFSKGPPTKLKPSQDECLRRLKKHITEEKPELGKMVIKDMDQYGKAAANMVSALIDAGCIEHEVAIELSILTLYDLVILIDDSASMGSQKNIDTLTSTLEQICDIYSLANMTDGIKSIQFINNYQGKGKVKKEHLSDVIARCAYAGLTRIGTELHRKVLLPFVLGTKTEPVVMTKPLLVMVITDGTVEGERKGILEEVIISCTKTLKNEREHGDQAVAFQFTRIGNHSDAIELLRTLKNDENLENHVDCLPESINLADISDPRKKWTEKNKWEVMSKLLMGAIVPNRDKHMTRLSTN